MKLFKYKSIDKLWHILDTVLMARLFCAQRMQLNDPLEGRYITFLQDENLQPLQFSGGHTEVDRFRDNNRIASLSTDGKSLLMWSHYSSGHRGVVIEITLPTKPDCIRLIKEIPV